VCRCVHDVVIASNDPSAPRQLVNAAWTSQRAEHALHPESASIDCMANTNKLQRQLMTMICKDGEGRNIIACQALLHNLRRRSFNQFFARFLPQLLDPEALQAMAIGLTDRDPQEIGGFLFAKSKGVFNKDCHLRHCAFHELNQGLENPENCGASHISPTVYDRLLRTLHRISTYCETEVIPSITLSHSLSLSLLSLLYTCVCLCACVRLYVCVCVCVAQILTQARTHVRPSHLSRMRQR
jgi:hypothetical protein